MTVYLVYAQTVLRFARRVRAETEGGGSTGQGVSLRSVFRVEIRRRVAALSKHVVWRDSHERGRTSWAGASVMTWHARSRERGGGRIDLDQVVVRVEDSYDTPLCRPSR